VSAQELLNARFSAAHIVDPTELFLGASP